MLQHKTIAFAGCLAIAIANNGRMKYEEIVELRRERLSEFLGRFPTDVEASDALGITPNYLNQLKRGKSDGGRNMSEKVARKLEAHSELPPYWFDGFDKGLEILRDREKTLLKRFRRMTDRDQLDLLGHLAFRRAITPTRDSSYETGNFESPSVHEDEAAYLKGD